MKKLMLISIICTLLFSCSKTEIEDTPTPNPDPLGEQNFIKYLHKLQTDSIFEFSKFSSLTLPVIYNINNDEISSYGFVVWQTVSSKINSKYWTISFKQDLEKRKDTLRIKTNFYEHFSDGDSAYFIVELLRRKSENTYTMLAADTAIFLIKPK